MTRDTDPSRGGDHTDIAIRPATLTGAIQRLGRTGCAVLAVSVPVWFRDMPARAASDLSMAALAVGRLYVVGTTDKPRTSVALDRRFHTVSDENGRFSFEEIYHPVTCIVSVEIEARTYRAVVSNCAQQMPIGPLPFVGLEPPKLSETERSAAARPARKSSRSSAIRAVRGPDAPRPPRLPQDLLPYER